MKAEGVSRERGDGGRNAADVGCWLQGWPCWTPTVDVDLTSALPVLQDLSPRCPPVPRLNASFIFTNS